MLKRQRPAGGSRGFGRVAAAATGGNDRRRQAAGCGVSPPAEARLGPWSPTKLPPLQETVT